MQELFLGVSRSSDQQNASLSDYMLEGGSGWLNPRFPMLSALICALISNIFWYAVPCPSGPLSFLCADYIQVLFICLGFISVWGVLVRIKSDSTQSSNREELPLTRWLLSISNAQMVRLPLLVYAVGAVILEVLTIVIQHQIQATFLALVVILVLVAIWPNLCRWLIKRHRNRPGTSLVNMGRNPGAISDGH